MTTNQDGSTAGSADETTRFEREAAEMDVPFQGVLENIRDGFLALDRDFRCTYVNKAAAAFLGTTPDAVVGHVIWEAFPPARYPQLHAEITRAAVQRVFVKFQEYCEKCGHWFEWHCYPTDDRLAIFVEDVTERKRMEEALRKSEERYRKLFEANLAGVYITKLDGTIVDFNTAMMKMLGYDARAELLQKRSTDLYVDPEFRKELVRLIQQEHVVVGREALLQRKDGSTLYAHGAAALLRDEGTGELYIQGVVVDITERKRAEEALRASEERYRKLFEANMAGVYLAKLDGTILDFNEAMMKMLGYDSREEVFRHRVPDFYVDPELRLELIRLLKRDGIIQGKEVLLRKKDGAALYALGSAALVTDARTGEPCILGVALDITARKKAEEALRERERALRDLTGTLEAQVTQRTAELEHRAQQLQKLALELSETEDRERERLAEILHDDLQQTLAAAKFHVGLVRHRSAADPPMRQMIEQINKLLVEAISKSRSLSHELSPLGLAHRDLGETFEWLAQQIQAKHGLTIRLDVRDRIEPASEPVKSILYKAAQEMLFNVVKHAGVREATLRLRRRGGSICLSVSDKGRGFDLEESGRTAGSGLRSIRERISLLGGRMKVRSTKGKGSTFRVAVPDAPPPAAQAEAPSTEEIVREVTTPKKRAAGAENHVLRVLLADDHKIVREGIESILEGEPDIEIVAQAGDGQEAVDLACQLEPDVVVMDVSMPTLSGDEATRRIKRDLPQTRVVALSMHDETWVKRRMSRAGAAAYLLKTAPSEELLAAIRGQELDPEPVASSQ